MDAIEKQRREALETAIFTANLSRGAIPIEVIEEERMPDTKEGKVWLELLREEFASLKGVLFGQDGQGGFLPDIKTSLSQITVGMRQLEEQITTLTTQSIRDRAELEAKITEVKTDVNAVGDIARGARDHIQDHCQEMKDKKKWGWEKSFGIAGMLGIIASVFIAIFV